MSRPGLPQAFLFSTALIAVLAPPLAAQDAGSTWTFAVSGDSRNCGDFVMPAIAASVKAEKDAFYWHLGDFRVMSREPDQDLAAMLPAGKHLSTAEYYATAWDDFLTHQMASFAPLPVFLGRGNHETHPPQTRDGYTEKFRSFLDRPEIAAQRNADGTDAAPVGPWYHWTENGVDFITMDNSEKDEFSDEQLHWLRAVLDHDMAPNSGIKAIVMGAHEALPHSTGSEHAMDDWDRGNQTGDLVYEWFYGAQAAGKHVYLIASHSHYFSPDIFNAPYWKQHSNRVIPGWIIGAAGAHRYALPKTAHKGAKSMIYGYMQGTVHPDGTIDFALHELSEQDLVKAKWPNAPDEAIHECYVDNGDEPRK
ncbi:MAG TPA: hypothetical protein VKB38_09835 [Terracidiphilus sp.]|nr:hypothetical protein [Terracidiphilus sp.]